jgi:hypothetical protein
MHDKKSLKEKNKKKRKFFAERQRSALGKEVPLLSAKVGTRQRATFAERPLSSAFHAYKCSSL